MSCAIPGLTIVPDDDESGEGIEIASFQGLFRFPESYRYGNCRPRSDFQKLGTICEGSFGGIYKCQDKRTKEIYALKKISFTDEMMEGGIPESFVRHVNILLHLKHDNIVNSHGVVAGKKLESNCLLLDYCITSLQELITKNCNAIYERDVVKYMMKQLFEGLGFIHESLIVHRNLSCENILFTQGGTLKISGFRMARYYTKKSMTPVLTDPTYRAPELLFKLKNYGLPSDIWSAGCIFAKLLLKETLFTGESELQVLESMFMILGTPSENIWPGFDNSIILKKTEDEKVIRSLPYGRLKNMLAGLPDSSKRLLLDILIYYPAARLTAPQILKGAYIVNAPQECSSEKMASILDKALCSNQLIDVPMDV